MPGSIREWLHRGEEARCGLDSYTGSQTVTKPKRAVVVGGGFIGLEMVENFAHLGLEVTLIEKLDQATPRRSTPRWPAWSERYLVKHGVHLELERQCRRVRAAADDGTLRRPDGIREGPSGRRRDHGDRRAAGDRAREGRRARDRPARRHPRRRAHAHERPRHPRRGRRSRGQRLRHRPVDPHPARRAREPPGTDRRRRHRRPRRELTAVRRAPSICKIFEGEWPDRREREDCCASWRLDFEKVYLYQNSHAGYYPGAKMMAIKVLFRKSDRRLLGAQVLSEDGVASGSTRCAMAIQMRATMEDLEEAELCYAPPFGSAKDPVNFAGMVAGNLLRGDARPCTGTAPGRVSCSMCATRRNSRSHRCRRRQHPACPQLRARLGELPRDREIQVHLPVGGARLLRDAHPAAERFQGQEHLGRHAGAVAPRD